MVHFSEMQLNGPKKTQISFKIIAFVQLTVTDNEMQQTGQFIQRPLFLKINRAKSIQKYLEIPGCCLFYPFVQDFILNYQNKQIVNYR